MPYLFLPTLTPSPLRNETDAGVIANLTRKGWQETTPPTPGANQTARWDGTAKAWTLVDNPAAPPDYAGFEDALTSTGSVMTVNKNRMVPTITLSQPTTLAELKTAVLDLGQANNLTYEWGRFSALLDLIVAQGGDGDKAPMKTRFQARLWDWVDAANFGSPAKTTIQGLLDQYLPTRNYTAQRP
jgi:hypothetical protein